MTTSLEEIDQQLESARRMASSVLCAPVDDIQAVGGGRNSRVYWVSLGNSHSRALKVYFHHASDNRNRMQTEFTSLAFLWLNGVRNVPEALIASSELGCAVYSWIEGRKFARWDVTAPEIDSAAAFLQRLLELRTAPGVESLGAASEACFSGSAIEENLRCRLEPLRNQSESPELEAFLSSKFVPALDSMCQWSRGRLGEAFQADLPRDARTLSPSDFGFHNALKTETGDTCFLDFEYFGWDDPAKTICDFLLHPGMLLPEALKRRFAQSTVGALPFRAGLRERVEAYYPLFGLKWCLILLNEFLPAHLLRRRFAGMSEAAGRIKQAEQLDKAERMLQGIIEEYERFPYFD